jgi:hypothetical protein
MGRGVRKGHILGGQWILIPQLSRLTAIRKRLQRNRQGYERREKEKKKRRGRDMAGGEEADGVVEGVGKVDRVTGEGEVEVTGTRCYNNNSALHL